MRRRHFLKTTGLLFGFAGLAACGAADQAASPADQSDQSDGQAAQAPTQYAFPAVREGHGEATGQTILGNSALGVGR